MKDLGAVFLTVHRQREGVISVSLRKFTSLPGGEVYCFVAQAVDEDGRSVSLSQEEREVLVRRAKFGEDEMGR